MRRASPLVDVLYSIDRPSLLRVSLELRTDSASEYACYSHHWAAYFSEEFRL